MRIGDRGNLRIDGSSIGFDAVFGESDIRIEFEEADYGGKILLSVHEEGVKGLCRTGIIIVDKEVEIKILSHHGELEFDFIGNRIGNAIEVILMTGRFIGDTRIPGPVGAVLNFADTEAVPGGFIVGHFGVEEEIHLVVGRSILRGMVAGGAGDTELRELFAGGDAVEREAAISDKGRGIDTLDEEIGGSGSLGTDDAAIAGEFLIELVIGADLRITAVEIDLGDIDREFAGLSLILGRGDRDLGGTDFERLHDLVGNLDDGGIGRDIGAGLIGGRGRTGALLDGIEVSEGGGLIDLHLDSGLIGSEGDGRSLSFGLILRILSRLCFFRSRSIRGRSFRRLVGIVAAGDEREGHHGNCR